MYFTRPKFYFEMTPEELEEARRRSEEKERQRQEQHQQQLREQEEINRQRHLHYMRLYHNHSLFLQTEGLYVLDPKGSISSQELYTIYQNWCIREKMPAKPPREFWLYIKQNAPEHGLTYSGNIIDSTGKRCRGFRGIRAISHTDNTDNTLNQAPTENPRPVRPSYSDFV